MVLVFITPLEQSGPWLNAGDHWTSYTHTHTHTRLIGCSVKYGIVTVLCVCAHLGRLCPAHEEVTSPLDHVFIDELGHDGDGHGGGRSREDVLDLGVLHTHTHIIVIAAHMGKHVYERLRLLFRQVVRDCQMELNLLTELELWQQLNEIITTNKSNKIDLKLPKY